MVSNDKRTQYLTQTTGFWPLILSLLIFNPTLVHAKPPPFDDLPPTTGGQSAGSRGCDLSGQVPLQLIVPPMRDSFTGTTTPSLAWYQSSEQVTPLEFRIYQYDTVTRQADLIVELRDPPVDRIGNLAVFQWPSTVAPLLPNYQYIWQVELVCDPNRPSGNVFADAPLRILPNAQATAPILSKSPRETDEFPGYDALAQFFSVKKQDSLDRYYQSLKTHANTATEWQHLLSLIHASPQQS